jgi:hypothetical protein
VPTVPIGGPSSLCTPAPVEPFNFIISCHVRKLGHPIGADPERFHLIAPYETDPRKWGTALVPSSGLARS